MTQDATTPQSAAAVAAFLGDDPALIELHDTALDYKRRGLDIVVCDGKAPMGGKGWQHREVTPEVLPQLLRQANAPAIGIKLGPSSGLIDIEADGPEEDALVAKLFEGCEAAPTPTYRSTRGLHRLFRFDSRLLGTGAGVINFKNGGPAKLGCRVGADGKGAQSVAPPSVNRTWLEGLSFDDVDPAPLPDVVVVRLLAANAKASPTPTTGAIGAGVRADVLKAMRKSTAKMVDGSDGSKRLFTAVCRGVELDASDAEILATVRALVAAAPFPASFTDAEIVDRIRDAEKKVTRGSAIVIANFEELEVDVEAEDLGAAPADADAEKQTETITVPKSMQQIIDDICKLTGNWPRRVDNMVFVDDSQHGLGYFDRRSTAALFGWLRRKATVKWAKGSSYVAQTELFAEIERTAQRYDAIEALPHEPLAPGVYYHGKTPPAGDGKHLSWLLDRFRPATTIDRDLIQAAFMTALWGGAPGRRPAFVITSDDGLGVGKSTIAEMIGYLCGGFIDVSAGEDIGTLKTRFLTPSARTLRVALLDNVKTLRLSWAELEALITSPVISGRQLFVGEGQRPNMLLWILTLNGVSMATDMAQRSVIVKVVKGANDGPWYEQTIAYIDQHRAEIIGDIIGALRAERFVLPSYSRWATWERDVLCRLPEPAEAQRVILERQGEANCEMDEAEIIEQYFAEQLQTHGYNPATAQVRVPVATAAFWFSKAVGEPTKTAAASKRLHQMASEGQLKRLSPDKSRTHGRSFIWTGPDADVFSAQIQNDLGSRIADCLNNRD